MQTKQKPGYENVVDSWSVGIIVYRCVGTLIETGADAHASMMTKALPFDEDAELPVDVRRHSRIK